jgi:integrase/recombinase XerD
MTKAYLEVDDIKKIESAARYVRDKLLIRILFRLGCRISEALNIAVDDIDFDRKLVTIQHLKVRMVILCNNCGSRLSKSARFCPTCGKQVDDLVVKQRDQKRLRTLPIDDDTLEFIKDYIKHDGPINVNGRKLLFGISRNHAWRIIKDCAERVGIKRLVNPETGKIHYVSPHKLRDAFAIIAMRHDDSGDGLRLLQEHLGHQNFNTTAKYRKVSGDEHREWYQNIWSKN